MTYYYLDVSRALGTRAVIPLGAAAIRVQVDPPPEPRPAVTPPTSDISKRCNGPCGRMKYREAYGSVQWMKSTHKKRCCLICSTLSRPTSPPPPVSSRVVVAAAKVVTTKDKEKKMTASKSWNAPVSKEEEAAIVAAVAENRAAAASLAVSMAMTPLSSMKAINPPSMEETT